MVLIRDNEINLFQREKRKLTGTAGKQHLKTSPFKSLTRSKEVDYEVVELIL